MAETIVQAVKKIIKRVVCLYRVSTVGQVEKDDMTTALLRQRR